MSINQNSGRKTFRRRFVSGSLFVLPCPPECYLQSETKPWSQVRHNEVMVVRIRYVILTLYRITFAPGGTIPIPAGKDFCSRTAPLRSLKWKVVYRSDRCSQYTGYLFGLARKVMRFIMNKALHLSIRITFIGIFTPFGRQCVSRGHIFLVPKLKVKVLKKRK